MSTSTPRHRRSAIAAAVLALAGAVSGLAAAGSSTVATPQLGGAVTVPADKAAAMADRMPSAATDATPSAGAAAPAALTPEPIPAATLGSNAPAPVSASIITVTNGWIVSNGITLVAVYAGSAAGDPTQGRVVIVRQDFGSGAQTVKIVDAGATGPLTVMAGAPTGAAVETSALTGRIPLSTGRGPAIKLNLATDTVSGN
jgi:hypothetical protein